MLQVINKYQAKLVYHCFGNKFFKEWYAINPSPPPKIIDLVAKILMAAEPQEYGFKRN